MALIVVDEQTGERINEIGSYRTPSQQEKYRQIQDFENYRLHGSKKFVTCFHETISEATPHLSLTECGAIMKLLMYMKMNSEGILQKDGVPLKQSDLEKILGRSKRQVSTVIHRLEASTILISVRVGKSKMFYMNQDFHLMGKGAGKRLFTKLMTGKLKSSVKELKLEELGFLYKVLPYFHFDTCVLAHNPNELDEKKIEYMNREELAATINYDECNVTTLVNKLRKKGLIMATNSCHNVIYYVHPDLMYRKADDGNSEKFNVIRSQFLAHQANANNRRKKKD